MSSDNETKSEGTVLVIDVKKGFSLDMNTVFFAIVAVAFAFMALGTFFPAHQRLLNNPTAKKYCNGECIWRNVI